MTHVELLEGPDGSQFIHFHDEDVSLTMVSEITDDELQYLKQTINTPRPVEPSVDPRL